jgi:hypothetical protein
MMIENMSAEAVRVMSARRLGWFRGDVCSLYSSCLLLCGCFLKMIVRLWTTEVIRESNYWCTVLVLGHVQFGGLFGHDGSADNFARDLQSHFGLHGYGRTRSQMPRQEQQHTSTEVRGLAEIAWLSRGNAIVLPGPNLPRH